MINCAGLLDLGFNGPIYTWSNRRHEGLLIQERLDRVLANPAWLGMLSFHLQLSFIFLLYLVIMPPSYYVCFPLTRILDLRLNIGDFKDEAFKSQCSPLWNSASVNFNSIADIPLKESENQGLLQQPIRKEIMNIEKEILKIKESNREP